MNLLRYVPKNTKIDFIAARWWAFGFTIITIVATVVSLWLQGLNLGIDFTGGVLIEVRAEQAVDVGRVRQVMEQQNFGEVAVQAAGEEGRDVLVRLQPGEGQTEQDVVREARGALGCPYQFSFVASDTFGLPPALARFPLIVSVTKRGGLDQAAVMAAAETVPAAERLVMPGPQGEVLVGLMPQEGGPDSTREVGNAIERQLGCPYEFLRTEAVGPKVSGELFFDGVLASVLAVLIIALYVAFRFEWQFGISAIVATGHDVLVTVGMFSLLQLDFNLATVAALLTLAGYSINDTVIVFDRIRENRRRYKKMPLTELMNLSVNQTLTRTIVTGLTTLIAVLPVFLYGGPTLLSFSAALLFGIIIGTYSSIYVASALLLYLPTISGMEPLKMEPEKLQVPGEPKR